MATTVPAGVSAAFDSGRLNSSWPYSPSRVTSRQQPRQTWVQPDNIPDGYVPVMTSVIQDALRDRAEPWDPGEAPNSPGLLKVKNPAEALILARQLLSTHRAYGLSTTRDTRTPREAATAAKGILSEWRRSGRTNLHLHTIGNDESPHRQLSLQPEVPALSPQASWMAYQTEMRDLQDALYNIDEQVDRSPATCSCPPKYKQGSWGDAASQASSRFNPNKTYYEVDEMLECTRCGVNMLPTSNYCHHCATKINHSCKACRKTTKLPATHCGHCGKAIPPDKDRRGRESRRKYSDNGNASSPSMYSPPASELRVPPGMVVDLDYTGEDDKGEKSREKGKLHGESTDSENSHKKDKKKDKKKKKKKKKHKDSGSYSSGSGSDYETSTEGDEEGGEEEGADEEKANEEPEPQLEAAEEEEAPIEPPEDEEPVPEEINFEEPIADAFSVDPADLSADCPAGKDNTCTELETDVVNLDDL
eukprot:TRINITY_DN1173_c4_g1_i1.p1 TRINITY_DN1173_c4_g1~~TRINITY_DN1173_c4_g1_i1.p1  ORF type:complete len:475 (+),score=98.97 TRINITY_DN1173_c4_g1_i1:43-1467(+)